LNDFTHTDEALAQWGLWRHKLSFSGAAAVPETGLGRAVGGIRGRYWQWLPTTLVHVDRCIERLPPKMQRALVAEYALPGAVPDKFEAAGMPKSTYYRVLQQAKRRVLDALG